MYGEPERLLATPKQLQFQHSLSQFLQDIALITATVPLRLTQRLMVPSAWSFSLGFGL
jgi:hypothetical protein